MDGKIVECYPVQVLIVDRNERDPDEPILKLLWSALTDRDGVWIEEWLIRKGYDWKSHPAYDVHSLIEQEPIAISFEGGQLLRVDRDGD